MGIFFFIIKSVNENLELEQKNIFPCLQTRERENEGKTDYEGRGKERDERSAMKGEKTEYVERERERERETQKT